LKEAGYNTVESLLFTPMKTLVLIKGISENKLLKILEACQGLRECGFMSATDYFQKRKKLVFISTGSNCLGNLTF
jgi:DNA repair protein RAD51